MFAPAISHGLSIGPYNNTVAYGLTYHPAAAVPNEYQSDLISEIIPWSNLAWTDVHHGMLPLWNPYNALGTPLAFNWQSSAFSLPAMLGYLVPLRMTYTFQCVLTTLIAGWGAYFFCRTVRLGILASTFAGTTFLLSGAFFAAVGWPIAAVFSWLGWILAGVVIVKRGRHRVWGITLLAVASAFSVYAGQPDCLVITAVMVALFFLAEFLGEAHVLGGGGVRPRFALDTASGLGIGILLSAPLLLPGAQLISHSSRSAGGAALGAEDPLSVHGFAGMLVGFDGSLVPTATDIGSVTIVLAAVAILSSRRNTHARSILCVGAVAGLVAGSSLVISALTSLPGLNSVRWPRALVVMVFALSILAAFGLDRLVRHRSRRDLTIAGIGFCLLLVAVVVLAAFGGPPDRLQPNLQWPYPADIRGRTLLAEGLLAALGASVTLGLRAYVTRPRSDRVTVGRMAGAAGLVLLVAETAFLVVGGSSFWISGPGFTATPAEITLQRSVGVGVVGLTGDTCLLPPGVGLSPNTNIFSGVREMAVYDPMLPKAYYSAWQRATGNEGGASYLSTFCPDVSSVAVAREFGISYVLVIAGGRAPVGMTFVKSIGRGSASEDLYRVPDTAAAAFVPDRQAGATPGASPTGTPLRVSEPDDATWITHLNARRNGVVQFHLTASPGWSATIDGASLPLRDYGGIMLQANVPPGRHTIVLRYWPPLFTLGLVLAGCGLIALGALGTVARVLGRRRGQGPTTSTPPATPLMLPADATTRHSPSSPIRARSD